MFHFTINDPNRGLRDVLHSLEESGISESSRNGPVLRFPMPVCLEYVNPRRRVLNSPIRDANPFFHLFETMWMFAGMEEIQPLLLFNAQMAQYSDDGKKLRGTAYGYRWREKWGDQLARVVTMLKENPYTRQIVMSMWDPNEIFTINSKDFACNLQVMFSTRTVATPTRPDDRFLDMTVTNRSNDLIYGAMGSNMFHFSMLLEYVAMHSGLKVGTYYQISNNLHLYTENETAARCLEQADQLSETGSEADDSLTECGLTLDKRYIRDYVRSHESPLTEGDYLARVVRPLVESYRLYKSKSIFGLNSPVGLRLEMCQAVANNCMSKPLRDNAIEWFERRKPTDFKWKEASPEKLPTLTEAIRREFPNG